MLAVWHRNQTASMRERERVEVGRHAERQVCYSMTLLGRVATSTSETSKRTHLSLSHTTSLISHLSKITSVQMHIHSGLVELRLTWIADCRYTWMNGSVSPTQVLLRITSSDKPLTTTPSQSTLQSFLINTTPSPTPYLRTNHWLYLLYLRKFVSSDGLLHYPPCDFRSTTKPDNFAHSSQAWIPTLSRPIRTVPMLLFTYNSRTWTTAPALVITSCWEVEPWRRFLSSETATRVSSLFQKV